MSKPFATVDWVSAAGAGDEVAWSLLYNHYYPDLYAGALRMCNDHSAAKDLVQESFVTAYLKLAQLKDPASFGGWLWKILVRQCFRIRSKRMAHDEPYPELPDNDPYLQYTLEEKLDEGVRNQRLHTTIALLPEVLCSVVLLRYFTDHQSYQQMADILSIPVGTVRSRLNEARSRLAEKWVRPLDGSVQVFRESNEWNQFYKETLSALHRQDTYKNKFLTHLQKDVQIISPHRPGTGRGIFENMICNDLKYGSWLSPTTVSSCGNISVVEVNHYNSAEHPHHCPQSSVMVLHRRQLQVRRINIHLTWR